MNAAEMKKEDWLAVVAQPRGLVTGPEIRQEIETVLRECVLGRGDVAEVLASVVIRERMLWSRLPVPGLARPVAEEFPEGFGGVVPAFHAEGDFTPAEREVLNYGVMAGAGEVAGEAVADLKEAGVVVVTDGAPEALVAGEGSVEEAAGMAGDGEDAHARECAGTGAGAAS